MSDVQANGDRPFNILAIDGGGIRGIIPAVVLVELERLMGRPITDFFDMIVGTSTGGILALGLTVPVLEGGEFKSQPRYSAKELLGFYMDHGHEIFRKSERPSLRISNRMEEFSARFPLGLRTLARSLGKSLNDSAAPNGGARYHVDALEEHLLQFFAPFSIARALKRVLVPAYDLENGRAVLFDSEEAYRKSYDPLLSTAQQTELLNPQMWEVARATSAAPTYFPPYVMHLEDGETMTLVDGGVFANNPAMVAYLAALRANHSTDGRTRRRIQILSLGTGQPYKYRRADEIMSWGIAEMALDTFGIVSDSISDYQTRELNVIRQLPATNLEYWRINPILAGVSPRMDDADRNNVDKLKDFAERMVRSDQRNIYGILWSLDPVRATLAKIPKPS